MACVVVAIVSATSGAAYECVKYADASGSTPSNRREGRVGQRQTVPADVRHFDVPFDAKAASGNEAQARRFWRLGAAFEQPLHAQADAEQRHAASERALDRGPPFGPERGSGREVTDAGNDNGTCADGVGNVTDETHVRTDGLEGLDDRRQISGTVVDERDAHSRPFVDGNVRDSRLSFEQATRSARANALNVASI